MIRNLIITALLFAPVIILAGIAGWNAIRLFRQQSPE